MFHSSSPKWLAPRVFVVTRIYRRWQRDVWNALRTTLVAVSVQICHGGCLDPWLYSFGWVLKDFRWSRWWTGQRVCSNLSLFKCVLNTTAGCWALSVEWLKRSLVLSYFFGVISMVIFEVWNPEISNLELQPFHIQSLFGGLDSRTQENLGSHRTEA